MNTVLLRAHLFVNEMLEREDGQDLVEYALVVAMIAFGATAGMGKLASAINTAFSNISSKLVSSM
jgi:pilus assembly protein Flp/PilA